MTATTTDAVADLCRYLSTCFRWQLRLDWLTRQHEQVTIMQAWDAGCLTVHGAVGCEEVYPVTDSTFRQGRLHVAKLTIRGRDLGLGQR